LAVDKPGHRFSAEKNGSVPVIMGDVHQADHVAKAGAQQRLDALPSVTSAWRPVCRDGGAGPQAQVGLNLLAGDDVFVTGGT